MEKGINPEKVLIVGNTSTKRAITDVRDIINGFYLALQKGSPGEVYNISGEKVYSMDEIINILDKKIIEFKSSIKRCFSLNSSSIFCLSSPANLFNLISRIA